MGAAFSVPWTFVPIFVERIFVPIFVSIFVERIFVERVFVSILVSIFVERDEDGGATKIETRIGTKKGGTGLT
jgi:peptidoglycan biosynthesis protein MviN/MurJ (putative lipid II flippase)